MLARGAALRERERQPQCALVGRASARAGLVSVGVAPYSAVLASAGSAFAAKALLMTLRQGRYCYCCRGRLGLLTWCVGAHGRRERVKLDAHRADTIYLRLNFGLFFLFLQKCSPSRVFMPVCVQISQGSPFALVSRSAAAIANCQRNRRIELGRAGFDLRLSVCTVWKSQYRLWSSQLSTVCFRSAHISALS